MSTTECCFTNAVDREIITADRIMNAFRCHGLSFLWHHEDAIPSEYAT